MSEHKLQSPCYQVGELFYSTASGVLRIDGDYSQLRAREATLLQTLIEAYPEVVSREQLDGSVWKESYVTNATINQTIKGLRQSLQDDNRTLIRTIPKQGYMLSVEPVLLDLEPIEPIDITPGEAFQPSAEPPPAQAEQPALLAAAVSKSDTTGHTVRLAVAGLTLFMLAYFTTTALAPYYTPKNISTKLGNNWVLYDISPEDARQLPQRDDGTVQYFIGETAPRICTEQPQGLICHSE